jgi:hypothetical protein
MEISLKIDNNFPSNKTTIYMRTLENQLKNFTSQ